MLRKEIQRARGLRREMTEAERIFWYTVRAHRLMGLGFRRQHPVAGYYLDFACTRHRLGVEIDGSQHAMPDRLDHDLIRSRRLAVEGWRILRFWNGDVLTDLDGVCATILATIGWEHFK